VAVNPSDSAPALIALDAKFVISLVERRNVWWMRKITFIGPALDITRMNILRPGDLLTAIRLPGAWAGAQFLF